MGRSRSFTRIMESTVPMYCNLEVSMGLAVLEQKAVSTSAEAVAAGKGLHSKTLDLNLANGKAGSDLHMLHCSTRNLTTSHNADVACSHGAERRQHIGRRGRGRVGPSNSRTARASP